MSFSAVLSSGLRKGQNLRIILVVTIFFVLASISQYQVSFEFSIDSDGQVQSLHTNVGEDDIYYTHHIATYNPKDIKPWTKGDTLALSTEQGQEVAAFLSSSPLLQKANNSNNNNNIKQLADSSFLHLSKRLRAFRGLWNSLKEYYDQLEDEDQQDQFYTHSHPTLAHAIDLFQKMEKSLFPWILKNHPTSFDLHLETTKDTLQTNPKDRAGAGAGRGSVKNRGIVMCVGDKHSMYARTTIRVLREVLKSTLPIEMYYAGSKDLSQENREWFEKVDGGLTRVIDITEKLDQDLLLISGPVIKPFAMLVSSFQEVILMDSDAYFLQDPAILFEDGGYKEVGTVFFYDRTIPTIHHSKTTLGANKKRSWLYSFLPTVSNHPSKTRWYRLKGDQSQDSGVVVINKKLHFLGLLAICKMNDLLERNQITYRAIWGEKESFWIAMEMIQERYSFIRFGGGVIGDKGDAVPYKKEYDTKAGEEGEGEGGGRGTKGHPVRMDRVCGNKLHFNYQGLPLWWNSGLVREKSTDNSPYLKYTAWMRDEGGVWDIEDSCLIQGFHGALMEVEWDQRQTAFEMLRIDRAVAEELNQPKVKSILTIPSLVKSDGAKGGKGNNEAV
ncbi:hypothetical protein BGZ76_010589 [Entomortierella beljakovae]|nr:hypothetical protein BGZ76_010589 [Entomortierella beljakovae]